MEKINNFIDARLADRSANSSLRTLKIRQHLSDFCSNDYLGLSKSEAIKAAIESEINKLANYSLGSTGSRLISGNNILVEDLEQFVASFHHFESALVFNSGYDANVGVLSCLPQRGDTILLDEFVHASIIDGARLSYANRYTFIHNDLQSLEGKLKMSKGNLFIAVESVYSMDGDEAPLVEIFELAEKYNAGLIVDEAHALGIFGDNGRGLVNQYNLQHKILAQIVTFGKALGTHGAAVLCRQNLKDYLVNFARSFIYTTASAPHTHLGVKMAYQHLGQISDSLIHQKINFFKREAGELYDRFIPSRSPIQSLLTEGNVAAKTLAEKLRQSGFDVRAILHPTVPAGKERLRICLHTFNSDEEISQLIKSIKAFI